MQMERGPDMCPGLFAFAAGLCDPWRIHSPVGVEQTAWGRVNPPQQGVVLRPSEAYFSAKPRVLRASTRRSRPDREPASRTRLVEWLDQVPRTFMPWLV